MDNMKDMIIALQEAAAYQAEELLQLSAVLYNQQKEIAELRVQLKTLSSKYQAVIEGDKEHSSFEEEAPPPHY